MEDLIRLRRKSALFMVVFIAAHIPAVALLTWLRGGSLIVPVLVSLGLSALPLFAWLANKTALSTRLTIAAALIGQVSLLVYGLAGHPWQADMHMYYFAAIAMLAAFCDGRVVLTGATVTAVHHLVLNFVFPAAVFSGGSDFARVVLHAVLVVMETGALIWLCLMLGKALVLSTSTLKTLEEKTEAEAAQAERLRQSEDAQETKLRTQRRHLAEQFETRVGQVTRRLAESVTVMQKSAHLLATSVNQVADASQDVTHSSHIANDGAIAAASATQELHHSIHEIGSKIDATANAAQRAVLSAEQTGERVQHLAEAADRIGQVIRLIQDIAEQTNLLALNATIEAARAGDAGKGFAVVAAEVKQLATQTARATEDIQTQVTAIQSETEQAVDAIFKIGAAITDINGLAGSVAAAVHQQDTVTADLAGRVATVAQEMAMAVGAIGAISGDTRAARQVADTFLGVARTLTEQTDQLRGDVDSFLTDVRSDAKAA
ncbi:MAG: methyl-accepting chemotaxis protein [Elstera sp.]